MFFFNRIRFLSQNFSFENQTEKMLTAKKDNFFSRLDMKISVGKY